ncbi:hypothetical protein GH733_013974 [Mirounga leonina]|nr:hypothetical protein GH733_013974 [Mirounga leonina]
MGRVCSGECGQHRGGKEHTIQKDKEEASGVQSNMAKFYCDYCDPYLTLDSPSVRKTHCSHRKHKEKVKDYYQK